MRVVLPLSWSESAKAATQVPLSELTPSLPAAGIGFAGAPAAPFAEEASTVETDFSELQIEESSEQANGDVDLDLSADFAASDLASGEDEDLVIADDSRWFIDQDGSCPGIPGYGRRRGCSPDPG